MDELHESFVHTLPSLQLIAEPAPHIPPLHTSFPVQALPSLHPRLLSVFTQPETGLQESVVQMFPSSQSSGAPGWQTPPEQESLLVQSLPSSQDAALAAC